MHQAAGFMLLACAAQPVPAQVESTTSGGESSSTSAVTARPATSSSNSTDETGSTGVQCGNTMVDSGEHCDGAPLAGVPCPSDCVFARGEVLWTWTEETNSADSATSASFSETHGLFVAGRSDTAQANPLLLRLSEAGELLWRLPDTEDNTGIGFSSVAAGPNQLLVHGRVVPAVASGPVELLRAAYAPSNGEPLWRSYRGPGDTEYDQLAGPVIVVDDEALFFSIEERFGAGESVGVLARATVDGQTFSEVVLEAPAINRLQSFGDWTLPMMSLGETHDAIFVGGAAFRSEGSDHALVERRRLDGTVEFSSLYRNPADRPAYYSAAAAAGDGGVFVVGTRTEPMLSGRMPLVHRYGQNGKLDWVVEQAPLVNGTQNANAALIVLDPDTLVVSGTREAADGTVVGWLACLSTEDGALQWEAQWHHTEDASRTYVQDLVESPQGFYVAVGYGGSPDAPFDAFARAFAL